MKTTYGGFEKGNGNHEKKKNKLFSRTKLKPVYQTNISFFWWDPKFCFTSMKIVLQKCAPNKLLVSTCFQNYQNESSFYQKRKEKILFFFYLMKERRKFFFIIIIIISKRRKFLDVYC